MKDVGFQKEITTGCYLDPFNGFQERKSPLNCVMMKSPVWRAAFCLTASVHPKDRT